MKYVLMCNVYVKKNTYIKYKHNFIQINSLLFIVKVNPYWVVQAQDRYVT